MSIGWSDMESGRSVTRSRVVEEGEFIHSSDGVFVFMSSRVRVKEAILRQRGLYESGRTEENKFWSLRPLDGGFLPSVKVGLWEGGMFL